MNRKQRRYFDRNMEKARKKLDLPQKNDVINYFRSKFDIKENNEEEKVFVVDNLNIIEDYEKSQFLRMQKTTNDSNTYFNSDTKGEINDFDEYYYGS